jgi:hypothetical protein
MNLPEYEYFDIIIKSKDALGNTYNTATPPVITASTPYNLDFNLGSVYDTAPALQRYADAPYCDVKVKYFAIDETSTAFDSANTLTIQVKLNIGLPQTLETKRIADGNQMNCITSQTIGVVPTGISSVTYGDSTYDNEFVKSSNIFKGIVNITLTDQDDTRLVGLDKDNPYFMVLCVRFHKNPNLFNNV